MNTENFPPTDSGKRDFLKYLLGGSLLAWIGSVLYPVFAYLKPPRQGDVEVTSVTVGKLEEIPLDSGQLIKFGTKPVLLVRTANDELRAFAGTCTHLDCTVQYRQDMGIIWCACHNGKYDMNGRNIGGPPPKPLDEFRVIVQNGEVFISKQT